MSFITEYVSKSSSNPTIDRPGPMGASIYQQENQCGANFFLRDKAWLLIRVMYRSSNSYSDHRKVLNSLLPSTNFSRLHMLIISDLNHPEIDWSDESSSRNRNHPASLFLESGQKPLPIIIFQYWLPRRKDASEAWTCSKDFRPYKGRTMNSQITVWGDGQDCNMRVMIEKSSVQKDLGVYVDN
jgi:hypothetical protein